MSDAVAERVHHPVHYGGKDNPYECIEVLTHWLTPEQLSGFLLGNVIKYLCRAGKKDDALEDCRKASWYLDREIKRLQKENKGG